MIPLSRLRAEKFASLYSIVALARSCSRRLHVVAFRQGGDESVGGEAAHISLDASRRNFSACGSSSSELQVAASENQNRISLSRASLFVS